MIDRRNFFDQPVKNDLRNYPSFKNYYKLIATDLSKQQILGC